MEISLNLKTEQTLSEDLIQALKLVETPANLLEDKIKEKALENPFLKVREPSFESYDSLKAETVRKRNEDDDGEDGSWMEKVIRSKESLADHLLSQLGELKIDEKIRRLAETIITSLDANGFLPKDLDTLLEGQKKEEIDEALAIIRKMDPSGVGATDWKDSILLQAKNNGMRPSELDFLSGLLYDELEDIGSGKKEAAARKLHREVEDVSSMLEYIKTLTPYPGIAFSNDDDQFILPEFSIKRDGEGLTLKINRNIPSVSIDEEYLAMLEEVKKNKDKEPQKFLKDKLSEALSLKSQLDLRATTMEKLGAFLLEKQSTFFLKGPIYLKAITMQSAAEELGLAVSTISRAVSGKYVDTDFGLLPIRTLFSSSGEKKEGEEGMSREAICRHIEKILQEEGKGKKLSDQKIADLLEKDGIKISRRTVNKYRSKL